MGEEGGGSRDHVIVGTEDHKVWDTMGTCP